MKPNPIWTLVGLLWFVAALNYLDRQLMYSIFPLLQADLKLSNMELGLLSTSFLWVYALCSPLSGFLADRLGRVPVIVGSLLVWSAVTWATGHAGSTSELLLARALMGISEAAYLPAALALINDYHGEKTRSLASGLHQSGIYFGAMIGGAVGGWLGQRYGWRFAFNVLGVLGMIYAGVLWLALPHLRSEPGRALGPPLNLLKSVGHLFRLPGYPIMLAVFGLTSAAGWVIYTWLPLYIYETFHTSLTGAAVSATLYFQVASFGGVLIGGTVADHWSRTNGNARVLTQAAGLVLSAPFLFLSGSTSSLAVLVVGMVVLGLGRGFYDCNIMPLLCRVASPEIRATGYGVFNFVGTMVGGVTALAAGALKHAFGLGVSLQMAAVGWLIAGLLLLGLTRARRARSVERPAVRGPI